MTIGHAYVRTAMALWHLVQKGPWERQHQRRGRQLMPPAGHRVLEDNRTKEAQQEAFGVSKDGLALTEDNGYLDFSIGQELMMPPDWLLARIREAKTVTLRIDSTGGDSLGAEVYLAALEGKTTIVYVTKAGSAAAMLACCANGKRTICRNGGVLLHPPAACIFGNAHTIQAVADDLRACTKRWTAKLARRTGRPEAEVAAWLTTGNHYFSPAEALAAGLVDAVE